MSRHSCSAIFPICLPLGAGGTSKCRGRHTVGFIVSLLLLGDLIFTVSRKHTSPGGEESNITNWHAALKAEDTRDTVAEEFCNFLFDTVPSLPGIRPRIGTSRSKLQSEDVNRASYSPRQSKIKGHSPKVEFLIGGFQKSGTTSLHHLLAKHPDIQMHPREIHYFDHDDLYYNKEFPWYERVACSRSSPTNGTRRVLCGEKTPNYILSAKFLDRIADYNRNMKWILIARDPVSRALSQYRHFARKGDIAAQGSFEETVRRYTDWIIPRGYYYNQIEVLLQRFPLENILLLVHEEFFTDDLNKNLIQVWDFLGVEHVNIIRKVKRNLAPEWQRKEHVMLNSSAICLACLYAEHNERFFTRFFERSVPSSWNSQCK
mmetsp:Transcript_13361/g.32773  ORF Transcript_13361/g.32773 Transcript_13361/m.32773 type:complete len:374 (-) Transcript_13361:109-1230(-)